MVLDKLKLGLASIKEECSAVFKFFYSSYLLIPALIGFLVINVDNLEKWFDIVRGPTKLFISTTIDDEGGHYLVNISGEAQKEPLLISLEDLKKGVEMEPGSYHLSIKYFGGVVWEGDTYLEKNGEKVLDIPSLFSKRIRVTITNDNIEPFQGQQFSVGVTSSTSGCLWIYDIQDNKFKMILPNEISGCNQIQGGETKNITMKAGEHKESDYIVYLITKSKQRNDANLIMSTQFFEDKIKADVSQEIPMWGLAVLKYNISRL